tara:strand:- start:30440 stop:31384 length:945 start_codon:yes stop_codon:yes gene_type:complete
MHKIILDTDPGIDDAFTLNLAIKHPEIDLIGITTVFGNVHVDTATKNSLHLAEIFGQPNVPVAEGAAKPYARDTHLVADFVHGTDGLGNTAELYKKNPKNTKIDLSAAEFIVKTILDNPNEITICAIAPLTNLAHALELEPKIAKLVKQVVIMGGAVFTNGNVTPVSEANIYNDPESADKVFCAGWPITLVGLDVTLKVILNNNFLNTIKSKSKSGEYLYNISKFYKEFYDERDNYDGFPAHDPTALVYITNPELFKCIIGPIRVATSGIADGMTIISRHDKYGEENEWSNIAPTNVCVDVNADKVINILKTYV